MADHVHEVIRRAKECRERAKKNPDMFRHYTDAYYMPQTERTQALCKRAVSLNKLVPAGFYLGRPYYRLPS